MVLTLFLGYSNAAMASDINKETWNINKNKVTSFKIAIGAVTTGKIKIGAVNSLRIKSAAVTESKIKNVSVNVRHLATALMKRIINLEKKVKALQKRR